MAKSSKTKTGKSKIDDAVADTVEVADDAISDVAADTFVEADKPDDVPNDEDGLDPVSEADVTDVDLDMEIVEDPIEPTTEETPEPEPTPAITKRQTNAGFFPLLLGGIAAGAIGYGIATYFPMNGGAASDEITAQLAMQSDQIAALEAELANLPAPDLSAIDAQIAAVVESAVNQIDALSADITGQFESVDARLLEVEKRPGTDGTLSETALAAYERELEELRADLNAQQENVMSAAAQAEADLAAVRAEAEQLEREAISAAQAAAARAALNRVAAAVEIGAPFGDALSDLGGDVPAALNDVADTGVATTAQLTADFPAAARAALATARSEGVSDDAGGLGGFFRSQFDVRSTSPKEGSGPDAILSRAEAAVKEGRVSDALAEIEALPEVARAELTDWTARATQRADVLDAIATLSETYN